jgi:3-oxoadipate enol-lactonase
MEECMPYLERAGAPRLYYELDDYTDPWKNAPCIVLQHGYARSSRFWRAWVPYLSRYYKVLRPDLRGLGRSSTDFDHERGIHLQAYIDDFTALLDHVGADRVHYCGESSAGALGMAFAAECASRIRTLTLISAPVYMTEEDKMSSLAGHPNRVDALRNMGSRGWLEASNAGRRFPADTDPALLAWTLDEMAQSNVDVLIAMFKFVSQVNCTPYLSRITAPVLGLYPIEGVITKSEHTDLLMEHVRNLTLVRLPVRAHSLHVVRPATCALEVLHFAGQHDGIACNEA